MDSGIQVTYHVTGPASTRIPLALDPQAFYFGPTSYQESAAPGVWRWGLESGIQVEVRTDASLAAIGFIDSLPFLNQPEEPDRDYPAGHYLPFPLSVVTVSSTADFSVQVTVK
jgi:hypothetical protein